MASSEDTKFNTACYRGRSKAQMSVEKILDTISAGDKPQNFQPIRRQDDEGLDGESLVGRKVEKRRLLNIDLNVAPPEDDDYELTAAEGGGNGHDTPAPPPADVVPDGSVEKVGLSEEREPTFNGIGEGVGVDAETKVTEASVDSEAEMEEKDRRNRRWIGLLEIAENELSEKREEEEARNRKRRASEEAEVGAEAVVGTMTRSRSAAAEGNGEVVARSTRGRAVAMPNKYRDTLLGAVPVLPRQNKNGNSATVLPAKRKSR